MACQACFGSLDEVTLSKHNHLLLEKLQHIWEQTKEAKQRYDRAVRELRNEKQRQRNRRIREKLERQDSMSAQHLTYIESMVAAPGKTIELEYQRRIRAIDEGAVYCGTEEGRPTRRTIPPRQSPPDDDDDDDDDNDKGFGPPAKRPRCSADEEPDCALQSAIKSVVITELSKQPVICFPCARNPQLPMSKRIKQYKNSRSLT